MVTTAAPTRRGPAVSGKYKFQVLWEIDTLAMVNARDVGRESARARSHFAAVETTLARLGRASDREFLSNLPTKWLRFALMLLLRHALL